MTFLSGGFIYVLLTPSTPMSGRIVVKAVIVDTKTILLSPSSTANWADGISGVNAFVAVGLT